ncbi:hypothetical protein [Paucibacter soli]|uniref:hypothetical protein n=1 Tax=Paucibacter soli TaxID=3133433 RepID=UPI00309B1846
MKTEPRKHTGPEHKSKPGIVDVKRPGFAKARVDTFKRYSAVRMGILLLVGPPVEGSRSYLLTVRCARKHEFDIASRNLARGIWCAECARIETDLLKEAELKLLQAHAQRMGGLCLSGAYKSAKVPVKWRCFAGHEWGANWDNVKNKNSWCPICQKAAPRPGRAKKIPR